MMFGRITVVLLASLLMACGGGGNNTSADSVIGAGTDNSVAATSASSGPGDVDRYIPAALGDSWTYDAIDAGVQYTVTDTVISNQVIGTITNFVVRELSSDTTQLTRETTYFADPGGVTQVAVSPPDILERQVGAFRGLLFPVLSGSFIAVDKFGLDFGEDLDGDGKNETADLRIVVTLAGFEAVDVPAGSFAQTAKYIYTAKTTVKATASDRSYVQTSTSTEWRAPGVGLVKQIGTTSDANNATLSSSSQLLRRYSAQGVQRGLLEPVDALDQGSVTTLTGGMRQAPAVAAGNNGYLAVAFRQVTNSTGQWIGRLVAPDGSLQASFEISPVMSDFFYSNPSVAFDGTNYLVVAHRGYLGRSAELVAWRVSPQGVLLDGATGLTIGTGVPQDHALAFDGTRYLVVFAKEGTGLHLYGSFIGTNGSVGDEFQITSASSQSQGQPALSFDGVNYLLVWQQFRVDQDIMATRLTPAGQSLDGEGFVICSAVGAQGSPKVVFGGDNYLVVWVDQRNSNVFVDASQGDIYAARIDRSGALLDKSAPSSSFAVHVGDGSSTIDSHVAVAYTGKDYLVTWSTGGVGFQPTGKVLATTVSSFGGLPNSPSATGWEVSSQRPRTPVLHHGWPAAAGSSGSALIAWFSNENNFVSPGSVQLVQTAVVAR
jgi:hypothetical protein